MTRAGERRRPGQRHAAADDLDLEAADPRPAVGRCPASERASLTSISRSTGFVRVMIGQSGGSTWWPSAISST